MARRGQEVTVNALQRQNFSEEDRCGGERQSQFSDQVRSRRLTRHYELREAGREQEGHRTRQQSGDDVRDLRAQRFHEVL